MRGTCVLHARPDCCNYYATLTCLLVLSPASPTLASSEYLLWLSTLSLDQRESCSQVRECLKEVAITEPTDFLYLFSRHLPSILADMISRDCIHLLEVGICLPSARPPTRPAKQLVLLAAISYLVLPCLSHSEPSRAATSAYPFDFPRGQNDVEHGLWLCSTLAINLKLSS